MRLLRIPEPFDHPEFLYEVKHDGFRALASVDRRECLLVSRYQCDGRGTSWLKIKNPQYSQMEGRRELFAARRDRHQRTPATVAPELRLA